MIDTDKPAQVAPGFSKTEYSPDFSVLVIHPLQPGARFIFDFPKRLPERVLEIEKQFNGSPDKDDAEVARKATVEMVSALITTEPQGFKDFPGAAEVAAIREKRAELEKWEASEKQDPVEIERLGREIGELDSKLARIRETPLADRALAYFDDPDFVELEGILASAFYQYKVAALPNSFLAPQRDSL